MTGHDMTLKVTNVENVIFEKDVYEYIFLIVYSPSKAMVAYSE